MAPGRVAFGRSGSPSAAHGVTLILPGTGTLPGRIGLRFSCPTPERLPPNSVKKNKG